LRHLSDNKFVKIRIAGLLLPSFAGADGHDAVTVYLSGGDFKTPSGVVTRKTGEAVFRPKGARPPETWVGTGTAPHTTEIALKDSEKRPAANTSGNPLAFPRPGTTKLIDNDRVFVWDSRWQPGVPTAMHFHDKDVVVSYLEDGDLTSIAPDGSTVVNPYKFGVIRFTAGNRSHKEVLTKGTQRAIIVELK
jgi:hypothetical protein